MNIIGEIGADRNGIPQESDCGLDFKRREHGQPEQPHQCGRQ